MKNILFANTKENVIDLLKIVGVDVSDWPNYNGVHPASNPKYCYEWSFIESGKVVVLNLWYEDIIEDKDTIYLIDNFKENAKYYKDTLSKPIWAKRALNMDKAIQTALKDNLVVRVIICNGKIDDVDITSTEARKVKNRMLDPVPWTISAYNQITGDCTITRGLNDLKTYDQFDFFNQINSKKPERQNVQASVFVRSAIVRNKVLSRANNCCECCGKLGFLTSNGGHYLETHHIIPLSEGGSDNELNVIALCPIDHRIAHYGKDKLLMQNKFKTVLKKMYGKLN